METYTVPVMQGMISVPRMTVPVVSAAPILPVAMEFSIVYPIISRRHMANIIRWYNHHGWWNKSSPNSYPRSAVKRSPEPIISIETIPGATVEIKAYRIRNQIDFACPTRNYHYIRGGCELQGWWRLFGHFRRWRLFLSQS
jgi:hypothetical protein